MQTSMYRFHLSWRHVCWMIREKDWWIGRKCEKDKGLDSKSGIQPFNAFHYLFL